AGARMFKFFDHQRRSALAHDKSVPQQVERTATLSGVARQSTHGLNDVERADGNGCQRCFCAASDNYICEIVTYITQRFAHGYCAAGATIRICCADSAKPELNRNVRVGRPTEYLDG